MSFVVVVTPHHNTLLDVTTYRRSIVIQVHPILMSCCFPEDLTVCAIITGSQHVPLGHTVMVLDKGFFFVFRFRIICWNQQDRYVTRKAEGEVGHRLIDILSVHVHVI